MNCACIRGNYDFFIKSISSDKFIYQDSSDWMEEPNYDYPDTYNVTITPPGEAVGKTFTFNVQGINVVSSSDFGVIKDGIWKFQVESCGVMYERYEGLFYSLECCLKKALATEAKRKYEKIKEIQKYLDFAKGAIEFQKFNEADMFLEIAQEKMDIIKCNC